MAWVPPLTSCVTLGQWVNLSEPVYHLIVIKRSSNLMEMLSAFNELMK